MSCSNNNSPNTNGNSNSVSSNDSPSSSVLPTSSSVLNVIPVTTNDLTHTNSNNSIKTLSATITQITPTSAASTQIQKAVNGNQVIISATTAPIHKVSTQPVSSQKVVSVVPAINGASSSTIGSSSATLNNNSNSNNTTNSSTTSSTDVTYPIQHYQTYNEGSIYQNTFYNTQNGQAPSTYPSTTTLAPSESQATAVYYMYPEGSIELDNGFELDGHVSHTAQAAPVTVQWLVDNFEPAEGCSLRRSSLYNFYTHHCKEHNIEAVNPASFGKLIRSVFLGLRTRRLGTRGNSKYHYYGIRVKASSPLNQIPEDHAVPSRSHTPVNTSKRLKTAMYSDHEYKSTTPTTTSVQHDLQSHHNNNTVTWTQTSVANNHTPQTITTTTISSNGNNNILKDELSNPNNILCNNNTNNGNNSTGQMQSNVASSSSPIINDIETKQDYVRMSLNSLPALGSINTENINLPDNFDINDVRLFEDLYKGHCQRILDLVVSLNLGGIEEIWHKFWRSPNYEPSEYENILSKDKFIALCTNQAILSFVKTCDYLFYQFCIDTLIPNVLAEMQTPFSQQIRNFAKSLENWLKNALICIPEEMQQLKIKIICAFALALRRYTTLNHLAAAAKALLVNNEQINQMMTDLNRVDFRAVQQQASWICKCSDEQIMNYEREFKKKLQNQSSVEDWAQWLDSVASACLDKYEGKSNFIKMAHQFLLKWSFYCSTIIRDLTLRSAPSFGGFHLIRLLYDEYMFYLIEHKIAKSLNETPIAVMSDLSLINYHEIDNI